MHNQLYWKFKKISLTLITILGLFTNQVKASKVEKNINYPLDTLQLIVEKQRIDAYPMSQRNTQYYLKFWNHYVIFDSHQHSIYIVESKRP